MKRVYNDIPLQSILYHMSGNMDIVIEDYARRDQFYGGDIYAEPINAWTGKVKDVWSYKFPHKFLYCKVSDISSTGTGMIIFRICTAWDQF